MTDTGWAKKQASCEENRGSGGYAECWGEMCEREEFPGAAKEGSKVGMYVGFTTKHASPATTVRPGMGSWWKAPSGSSLVGTRAEFVLLRLQQTRPEIPGFKDQSCRVVHPRGQHGKARQARRPTKARVKWDLHLEGKHKWQEEKITCDEAAAEKRRWFPG
jgi:hypothetical protein